MASLRPPPIPGERRQSQDGEQGKEDAREDGQDQGGEGHHEEGAHHVRSRCVARLLQRTWVCEMARVDAHDHVADRPLVSALMIMPMSLIARKSDHCPSFGRALMIL